MNKNSKAVLAAGVFLIAFLYFGDRREREERGLIFLPRPGCGVLFSIGHFIPMSNWNGRVAKIAELVT
jgi:hypothetical protein